MRWRYYLRIYRLLLVQHLKVKLHYRLDLVLGIFGLFFTNVAGVFVVWVMFRNIEEIKGWDYSEVIFTFGFTQLCMFPIQTFFDNIWELQKHLQQGSFINYYLRPLNPMFYYVSERLDLKGFGQLLIALMCLIYGAQGIELDWGVKTWGIFILLFFASSLVFIGVMLLACASGFWTMAPHYALGFTYRLKNYAHYPMSIFSDFVQNIFSFILPIAFMAYYPMQILLKPDEVTLKVLVGFPIMSVGLCFLAIWVWQKGGRSYAGTGT